MKPRAAAARLGDPAGAHCLNAEFACWAAGAKRGGAPALAELREEVISNAKVLAVAGVLVRVPLSRHSVRKTATDLAGKRATAWRNGRTAEVRAGTAIIARLAPEDACSRAMRAFSRRARRPAAGAQTHPAAVATAEAGLRPNRAARSPRLHPLPKVGMVAVETGGIEILAACGSRGASLSAGDVAGK